ncbi:nuclear transport factor 2 family protein [Massilia sp. PAMC28688]|uniref:nuclear transport factor 2 family protein n=1 Tax=Massilia sp. PAMC28688 TaxID=2861283 RepID=UPI001C6249C6|nr:nuclear transport factor 2 family protein [Massilia sp. PAMC28688]QYF94391.1 nuclear transport factor 2 family protein [Massilia sp. PAMC28688]
MNHQPALLRLVAFYETIGRDQLRAAIARVYAADAAFKDPFNEVRGIDAIATIFDHMFEQVDQPHFVVTTSVLQGAQAFLCWEFRFVMKRYSREPQCIRGATHIVFDGHGMVTQHRDYWDAAEELYEKLPVLGALMRWLKRSANR